MDKSKALQNRLIEFVINTVALSRRIPKDYANEIFFKQLIRCVSSIGANYTEAIFSYSRADFTHNTNICKKEAAEAVYWFILLIRINPRFAKSLGELKSESEEVLKIFISVVKTSQRNSNLNNKL